jgi:hypothetical protein
MMAVGDVVMYGVGQEMARTINTRHDVNLHAMPGEERPALVLEQVGDKLNLAVFLRSGRTWLVRDVAEGSAATPNAWWPRG